MATRKELIEGVGQRYRTSSGKDKPKILEELFPSTRFGPLRCSDLAHSW